MAESQRDQVGDGVGHEDGGGLVSPEFILLIDYQPMGPLVKVGRGESLFLKKLFPLISHVAVFLSELYKFTS